MLRRCCSSRAARPRASSSTAARDLSLDFADGDALRVATNLPVPVGAEVYVQVGLRDCRCLADLPDVRLAIWTVDEAGDADGFYLAAWFGADDARGDFGGVSYSSPTSASVPRREACGTTLEAMDLRVTRGSSVVLVPPGCAADLGSLRVTNSEGYAYASFPGLCNDERPRYWRGWIIDGDVAW